MKLSLILPFTFGILFLLFFIRKQCILRHIRRMDAHQKTDKLNSLIQPFGFSYLPEKDIITSTHDAWQRAFGYRTLFDETALHFNMVVDCEPVYFDYDDHTWLIEFWKGQYGINTGCEIGIYYTDSIIDPENRKETHFESAPDADMLPLEMELLYQGEVLFSLQDTHWWLTGFHMGLFSHPEELTLRAVLTFPNCIMLQSFVGGLIEAGYSLHNLHVSGCRISYIYEASCGDGDEVFSDSIQEASCCNSCRPSCDKTRESTCIYCQKKHSSSFAQAGFSLSEPYSHQPRQDRRTLARFKQWKNRLFCRLYLRITHPFTSTCDRLMFLYYLLPPILRRMLRFCKNKSQKIEKFQ